MTTRENTVSTRVVQITPSVAESMLAGMTNNRPRSDLHVRRLALIMERGEWKLNGETIKLNSHGVVIDGQHRLHACVMSGVTIKSLVAYGVEDHCFGSIDTGRMRSAADVIAIAGGVNCNATAAAVRYAIWMMQGCPWDRTRADNEEVIRFLSKNPGFYELVSVYAGSKPRVPCIPPSACAAMHFVFALSVGLYGNETDCVVCNSFFEGVLVGDGLAHNCPRNVLRKKLVQEGARIRKADARIAIAWTFKAFNAFESGKEIRFLKFARGEQYPELPGLEENIARITPKAIGFNP